jgi:hypothetical protein
MAGFAANTVDGVLARAQAFFAERQTRPGVLARRILGTALPGDTQLVGHLERERRRRTRMDGSVEGSLVTTAWTAMELLQLEYPPDHAGVVRIVGYVLARQGQPGRFGEGCTEERHARGVCQHFLPGFFSPAPIDVPLGPLTFPIGVTVRQEDEARFAASCFALQTVLRARHERRQPVRDHVLALLELTPLWNAWGGDWAPDLVFFALAAVAAGPLDYRDRVDEVTGWVADRQRSDGTWAGADPVHALDAMLRVPNDPARSAVHRGRQVVEQLADEGALFAEDDQEERSLVALRVLAAAA